MVYLLFSTRCPSRVLWEVKVLVMVTGVSPPSFSGVISEEDFKGGEPFPINVVQPVDNHRPDGVWFTLLLRLRLRSSP